MKGIVHKYDTIIIGATIESLLYALYTKTPVFYVVPKVPTVFDSLTIGQDYKFLKIFSELEDLETNNGTILTRPQKEILWGRLVFVLSLHGLLPISNLQSIRLDDGIIKLSTQNSRLIKLEAKQILLFDDEGVEGLPEPTIVNNRYIVKDFVEFNKLKFMDKSYDLIYTEYDCVNQIWFLPPSNEKRLKDGCLISYCNSAKEVQDDLTDYNIKFILKEQFEKYNMKGCENGIAPSGAKKYRPVAYSFVSRVVQKEKPNVFKNTDNIKFMSLTLDEIIGIFGRLPILEYMLCNRLLKTSLQSRKSRTLRVLSQSQVKP
jgi:hypothetical protein